MEYIWQSDVTHQAFLAVGTRTNSNPAHPYTCSRGCRDRGPRRFVPLRTSSCLPPARFLHTQPDFHWEQGGQPLWIQWEGVVRDRRTAREGGGLKRGSPEAGIEVSADSQRASSA